MKPYRCLRIAFVPALMSAALLLLPVRADAQESQAPGIDYEAFAAYVQQADLSEEEFVKLTELAELIKAETKKRMTFAMRARRSFLNPWVVFGFMAQFVFGLRFVWQLIVSERKKRSHVPVAFWYLSLVGGVMLFTYACKLRDPVFMAGQGLGVFVYIRNLILIRRRSNRLGEKMRNIATESTGTAGADTP